LFLESAQKPVQAANPKGCTISSTSGALAWVGDAPGGASSDETTCQDNPVNTPPYSPGLNCDAYMLTVGGAPADYTDKRIRIRFNWLSPSQDYDMVVRRESGMTAGLDNNDLIVGTSGNGTNTFEEVVFSPADSGVGVY